MSDGTEAAPDLGPELAALAAATPFPDGERKRLKRRRWILNRLSPGGIGAEIGVFRGHFTDLICEVAAPSKLYLVDPWGKMGETFGWGREYTNFGALRTADARREAELRAARWGTGEVVVIEDHYPSCSDRIVDQLDWAYLDASHHYEATVQELDAIAAQVRPDGQILGDDWHAAPGHQHHGVFRAVQDFCRRTDWRIVAAGPGAQWCIRRYPA